MLKFESILILSLAIHGAFAILCWQCDNAIDHPDCIKRGRQISCAGNQHGCQSEVRYHIGLIPPIRISKRCKQGLACDNNVGQNEKGFFPHQCNPKIPESICRCCCESDNCNKSPLGCLPDYPECRELNPVEHGSMRCHFGTLPPSVGEKCRFKCDDGYNLIGAEILECEALSRNESKWTDVEPKCEPKKCQPEHTNLQNGYVTCSDGNNVNSECDWECDLGYYMKGHSKSTCSPSQNWDYPAPKCIPVVCPPPLTPSANSFMQCSNRNFAGSVCQFTCEDGFAIQGSPDVICEDDNNGDQFGRWSHPVPRCQEVICQPQSRNPDNGIVKCSNQNRVGSDCTYGCDSGFAPSLNPPIRTCLADGDSSNGIGRWSHPEPSCLPVKCIPDQRAPKNGARTCNNQNNLGSVCDFFCNDGYVLKGSFLSICEDDLDGDHIGAWSNPEPTCEPNICHPEMTHPDNGRVFCTNKNNFRSVCKFTCNRGFYMTSEAGDAVPSGTLQTECGDFGVWSQQPPVCEPIMCNPPQLEDDILDVDCTDQNNYMSVCNFQCKDGTKPEGASSTRCDDDGNGDSEGIWVPPLRPTCRPRICQPPQINPQNGRVFCSDKNNFQSVCSFACDPGFYLVSRGGKTHVDGYDIECGKDSQWSGPPPRCNPITCIPPHRNPNNGAVKCSRDNNYLSRCDFQCDNGYELVGLPESICNDLSNGTPYGEWSTPAPTCENAGCTPPLVTPTNGGMRCSDGSNFKSTCTFTCDIGYYMVNSQGEVSPRGVRSTCQADNTWSEDEPTCQPITCPPQRSAPANGDVFCTDGIAYLSECTYECDVGYKLSTGFPTTVCQTDNNGDAFGQWSRPAPKCNPTSCSPKQTAPTNGKVSCNNGNTFGSVCSFSCNKGFYMKDFGGVPSTECLEGARWSRKPPTCAPITCVPPHRSPIDGSVTCTNRNLHESVCSFKCDLGFDLSGSPKSTCEDDLDGDALGEWSSPPPTCSIGACQPPRTAPENGRVICDNGNNFGSVCNYRCNAGYYMVHSAKIVKDNALSTRCQADKTWSRTPPTCAPITCKPPHLSLLNGEVECSNFNIYQSQCTFHCDDGYVLKPGKNSLQLGSPYTSNCLEDRILGDENGQWSDPAPTCDRGVCVPPRRNPANGRVSCTDGNLMGSICTYTCNVGYYMVGSALNTITVNTLRSTCLTSLFWDVDEPSCLPITCTPPHRNPRNGFVQCSNRNFHESVCTFECEPGYDMIGSPESTCNDDLDGDELGEWNEPPPTCSIGACKPPRTAPQNGRVDCDNGNNFGSNCIYTCDPGYYMVHDRRTILTNDISTTCQADKTWSRGPPTCEPIKCVPPFRRLKDGSVSCSNTNLYQSLCEFKCDDGFILVPDRSSAQLGPKYESSCEEDRNLGDELGEWTDRAPTCKPGDCQPPRRSITNGEVSCTDGNKMGSKCTYTCDAGSYMMGSAIVSVIRRNVLVTECLSTLQWDMDEPRCLPIKCNPPHSDPDNGDVRCTNSNLYESECTFKCNRQYILSGVPKSTCMDDGNGDGVGVWSSPPPTCEKNFCDPDLPEDPENGWKVCSDENNLGSECEFACDDYHRRVGPLYSRCIKDRRGNLVWSNPAPECRPNQCSVRNTIAHGTVKCSNGRFATSECTFECTEKGYFLYPPEIDMNTCLNDTHWDKRKPCCARKCPENAEMDAVFVLDSSSSVGEDNYKIMKDFVRSILSTFTVASDASRFAIFRYNAVVDTKSAIHFKDFTDSKSGLLKKFDQIPHNGQGTMTGQALKYVRDKVFTRANGDRPNVDNLVIIMTDGRSQDDVKEIADSLRKQHGAFIFVIGITPENPRSSLDMEQLLQISGGPDNLLLAADGFQGLTGAFALEVTQKVCGDPCRHETHAREIDNDDDGHVDGDESDHDR